MVVIQKNRHLIKAEGMQKLLVTLTSETKQTWSELVKAALDTTGQTSSMLMRIRNNAAFHYGPKDLGEGFTKQFKTDAAVKPHVANLTAQYSYGPDMDGTRFYFADAAAQQKMMMLGLQFGAPEADRTIVELADKVNSALVPMIGAFIESRQTT